MSTNGQGHNKETSEMNRDVIASVAKHFREIGAARAKLNERASKQRDRLKDAGIEPAAFKLVLQIADLEDEASRQHYMDSLAATWETLGVGGALDWVSAVEAVEEGDEVTAPEDA